MKFRVFQFALCFGAVMMTAPLSAQNVSVGAGSDATGGATSGGGAAGGGFSNDVVSDVYNFSDLNDPNQAFRGLALPVQRLYRGILPGLRDTLPHIRRFQERGLRGRKNQLTWVGYQRMSDKSRVFLQTFDSPSFEVLRGQRSGQLVVVLKDTRISLSNFRRVMDARWIPRSVASIFARRRGGDTYVYIQLRRQVEFSLSLEGNYLNIDFDDAFLEERGGDKPDPNDSNILDDPDSDI